MNYEEGSEPSVQDGEGHTDIGLTEAHGMGQTSRAAISPAKAVFEYGSRRLLAPDGASSRNAGCR